jgi:hypothetical protein
MAELAATEERELGEKLKALLAGPATRQAINSVRLMAPVFTSCPACGAEPWVNIDCKVCDVVSTLTKASE